jgi:hypothetical protein
VLDDGGSGRFQKGEKMSYTYKDNTDEVLSALKRAKRRGLEAIGLTAERHAKEDPNMPVDTGRARNSITYALAGEEAHIKSYDGDDGGGGKPYSGTAEGKKGDGVYIGSNVDYFPYIELGGVTMSARHVLQRAATEHTGEYKGLMEGSMKNA